jgi:spermidine/putrescine-binding protein
LTKAPNSVRLPAIRKEQHFWEALMCILPFRAAVLLGCGAIMAMAALSPLGRSAAAAELNALVWCDHSDPNLLKPFEEANGVKVNLKEFEGTGAGFAIVDQSQPGDWDVMVIDSIDVPRGVEKGLFEPLPEDRLPLADLYPEVRMDDTTKIGGKRLQHHQLQQGQGRRLGHAVARRSDRSGIQGAPRNL